MTASLAATTPASAATAGPFNCSPNAGVAGSTEGDGQITYLAGLMYGHCGTLGLRVYYTSVAGGLWTPWKYSGNGDGSVVYNAGNSAMRSQHTTTVGNLNFQSQR